MSNKKKCRVYFKNSHPTYFTEDGVSKWQCTHGGWTGTEVEGTNHLKHYYGITDYDSYKDITWDDIPENYIM
tara:strand:- start:1475 stop:1690 length:216 start_codon:yes stop_codon:yes gene_type:complete